MPFFNLPLIVSGESPQTLAAAAKRLIPEVESTPIEALPAFCYRRLGSTHASHRGAVVATDKAGFISGLTALAQGRMARNLIHGVADAERQPVFVFPGQGPLWPGMTTELLAAYPEFRERLNHYGEVLQSYLDWNPAEAIAAGEDFTRLAKIQPVQFTLASALADAWRVFGIREAAVVGHSVGEAAAAHASGYLSTEDAARLTTLWGQALTRIEGQGGMVSIAASVERIAPLLGKWAGRLDIAAVNSPRSVTVSGDNAALEELLAQLKTEGLWAWKVPGGEVAGHCHQVDTLREMVTEQAPDTASTSPRVALYSSVTGSRLDSTDLNAEYWFRILRETVVFEKSLRALIQDGYRLFIEVSPHPVLTSVIDELLRSAGVTGAAVSTLDRRKGDQESFLYALTHAFVNGAPIDWNAVCQTFFPQIAITPNPAAESPAEAAISPADAGVHEQGDPCPTGAFLDRTALVDRPLSEQRERLLGLVADKTEALLGQTFASDTQAFRDIGFTSLTVVELAKELSAATGLDLPSTLVYDYSTPRALSEHLRRALGLASPDEQDELTDAGSHTEEPIAIIGIGCRYPGGVTSPESLWQLVEEGRDAIGDYPSDRGWDTNNLYDPEPGKLGKISTRTSGFLYGATGFDAGFFGISPREATTMEPQQRLLLEVAWEAIERAGIDPTTLHGTNTGVFAGVMGTEYGPHLQQASEEVSGYGYMGTATCVASGRLAYCLGLEGPAITIDTACSSSLVAIHTASEALRSNDCKLALAAGVTVMPTPGVLIDFSQQRVLAPDGRCKAFSASADGVGLSEGIGVLLLERLSQAQANGHPILGVIRGSAVNQDGASNGLTAPSGTAQQQVIRRALANAGLTPQDIDVVEAHGTGTRLGDPIEANALLATYGQQRPAERPLLLGSIKSNIGHTQAAAGVAGVIKMVMAFRHGLIPRTLHVTEPSGEVAWSTGAVRLLTEQQPWPEVDGRPHRAAISSFGVSGTNGHLIVEQPPATPANARDGAEGASAPPEMLWPISAKTESALRAQAARLREHVISRPDINLVDIGYSLGVSRSGFPCRSAVWGQSRDSLIKGLQALAEGRDHPGLAKGVLSPNGTGKLVFVFPGQGSQWPEMGMALYDVFSVYRQAIDQVDEALRPFTDWSLVDVLRGKSGAPSLERVDVVQPALFAVMISLARLWQSFGLSPNAVVGHSQGEIAAAHIAGALTLQDAVKIVALRSKLMLTMSGSGTMATLGLSAEQAQEIVDRCDGDITLAVFNSPTATVVSGDTDAIANLLRRCKKEGVRAKRIAVDVAGHSPRLDNLRPVLLELFTGLLPNPTRVAFYSTVDGYPHDTPLDGAALNAEYWCDNLCNPVRFVDSTLSLAKPGNMTFLECSPHSVLIPAIEETTGDTATVIGTMKRSKPSIECLTEAMARLYVSGHDINWRALHPAADIVDVPTYPFEHRYYWLNLQSSSDVSTAGQRTTEHALLSAAIDLPDDEGLLLTGRIGLSTHPWLADHAAAGVVLVPGTAYLDMIRHAALMVGEDRIAELILQAPMVLSEQSELDLQLRVGPPDEEGRRPVTLHARKSVDDGFEPPSWTLHATALLTRPAPVSTPVFAPESWPPAGAEPVDLAVLRRRLAEAGYEYGPAFNGLQSVWSQGDDLYVEAHLPDELTTTGHTLHPALLDTVLHSIALPDITGAEDDGNDGLRLPFTFNGITGGDVPARRLRARLHLTNADSVSVIATDETGAPVLSIDTLNLRETSRDRLRQLLRVQPDHDLLRTTWSPLPSAAAATRDAPPVATWALLDTDPRSTSVLDVLPRYTGLSDLAAAALSATPPEIIIWPLPTRASADTGDVPDAVRAMSENVMHVLQEWLDNENLSHTILVAVTRRAMTIGSNEKPHLTHGPAWGLLHSAQNEHPGRIVLIDTDHPLDNLAPVTTALTSERPQLAVRDGQLYLPHLTRSSAAERLTPPSDTPFWRMDIPNAGRIDNLILKPAPEAAAPLGAGQIRLSVRAAGVNFYDVVCALGLIPPQHEFGTEAAGVVAEVGPGVERFAVGDRVMVMTEGAFGPVVIADQRTTVHIPSEWSFSQAAGVPVSFLTAYYALVNLANIQPGEKVLIHAAAGGVGQSAIQLARYLGAEIFATAHPGKWHILRNLGIPDDHIASSRTLDFAAHFQTTMGGNGIDVVLNSLTEAFIDASMDLMAAGGRFVEIGKTDVRDVQQVAATHPGIVYQYLDRPDGDPDATAQMLAKLLDLMRSGALTPLPVTAYGVRDAIQAFRLMQQGRHSGKIVLTFPQPLDPDGTVLITGGTGTLAGLLAHHLVTAHHVRHLVLASRSGAWSDNAAPLKAGLESLGATVAIVACDAADPLALKVVFDAIPAEHPLTGVFHTAGVLADATITSLTAGDLKKVFAPKVDAAWHLHQLTRHLDLAAFVLYSSSAGTLGSPGQGNYAAANRFLDSLAQYRHLQGLPATSLAWGWWQPVTGLSGALTNTDNARIARTGFAPITAEHGHALVDAALDLPYASLAAVPLNQQTLRKNSQSGTLHPLLERLAGVTGSRRSRAGVDKAPDLRKALAALEPAARLKHLQTIIAQHIAAILSLDDATQIAPDASFKESGLDSLMALELRNRLTAASGLRLPATLTYDFPTPAALAAHLGEQLIPEIDEAPAPEDEDSRIRRAIESIPLARLREHDLLNTLLQLAEGKTPPDNHLANDGDENIRTASIDELVALALSTTEEN
ncbi:type I polyketide synthase [Brenneria tiliae]|uniref:SDR family NAD(P)-dependent oxidoreductase n=1 Tax=Brenneria tiliae TaxID=2914984 RepID=A0ABT0MUV7_9GAMM|nr:type I polyketide synthase [Brenneria tiliae]MCL2893053.1 SDR family NAD(P)-dependent oxidoreductase [Brenneria tiliae]